VAGVDFKVKVADKVGHDDTLLHLRELDADACARTAPKGDKGVRIAVLLKKNKN